MAKIRDVEAKYAYRLLVELDNGNVIYLNMTAKALTDLFRKELGNDQLDVKVENLKNENIFNDVETDGYSLYWDFGRISMSLSEIYEMTKIKSTEEKKNNAI